MLETKAKIEINDNALLLYIEAKWTRIYDWKDIIENIFVWGFQIALWWEADFLFFWVCFNNVFASRVENIFNQSRLFQSNFISKENTDTNIINIPNLVY